MIVTVIADVLGEENNGTTIACMNLIRALKASGNEVRVVTSDADKMGKEGYYIVPELNLGPLFNYFVHKNGVTLSKGDKRVLTAAIKDCDVVHTTFTFDLSKAAIKIAKKYHKPITSSFHCQAENFSAHLGLMKDHGFNRLVYRSYYHNIYRYSDAIHYPTQFIEDTFEKAVHHKTPGYVISNGVNDLYTKNPEPKPSELKDKFIILSIGRLSMEKDHEILIKAIGESKYRDNIHLIIAGEGPLKRRLEKLASKLHVDMEINFYPRKELVKIINYSDLYVHPAEAEIEAIACLEAIKCGLVPVIANSKESATRYFALDEKSLFKSHNSHDLASKIEYWIEHQEEKQSYSERYLKTGDRYNQKECMDKMEKMMEEVIVSSKKGRKNQ